MQRVGARLRLIRPSRSDARRYHPAACRSHTTTVRSSPAVVGRAQPATRRPTPDTCTEEDLLKTDDRAAV